MLHTFSTGQKCGLLGVLAGLLLLTLMRAAKEVGYTGAIANLSIPDLSHEILARVGLAPTIGLGNVTIAWLRARAEHHRRSGGIRHHHVRR